jgi:hypothetical protein
MIWTLRLPTLRVRTLSVWARAAAVFFCLTAAPAGAQRTTLTVGQTVSAELDGLDPAFGSGVRFEVFEFQGRAGERVTATLRSADFDAVLRLARTVAGITDELEMDDDGGGDTDARLRASLPETGTYLLIAQAYADDEEGAFTLSLEATPEPTTATPQPLAVGQTVEAVLAETDALEEDEGVFYDVWTVEARAGERLVAVMEAESFDAYLRFGRLDADGAFEELGVDDDGGGGTDARLRARIPNTGVYELRATSLEESTGPYRVSLAEGVAPAETASREPIRAGETASGELSDADAVRDDEQYYDYWVYESRGDERLTVRLTSEAFDAFLEFGRLDGETFLEIDSNDDGPDGTDSELEVSLSSSGTYAIRASSYEAGRTGTYRIQVTRR